MKQKRRKRFRVKVILDLPADLRRIVDMYVLKKLELLMDVGKCGEFDILKVLSRPFDTQTDLAFDLDKRTRERLLRVLRRAVDDLSVLLYRRIYGVVSDPKLRVKDADCLYVRISKDEPLRSLFCLTKKSGKNGDEMIGFWELQDLFVLGDDMRTFRYNLDTVDALVDILRGF
jgi:hypothetical protein